VLDIKPPLVQYRDMEATPMKLESNPQIRNPLKFEDVALAASINWAIAEKSALKYFKQFKTPQEAFRNLRDNLNMPPNEFWESL
jgi:hypothetical protein